MRGILDTAEAAENRDLTAEEAQEFDRIEAEFDATERSIARFEKDAGLDPLLTRAAAFGDREDEETREVTPMEAFDALLRAKGDVRSLDAEFRAPLQVSPNVQGGFTVPQEWSSKIIEVARQFGVVEGLADSIDTQSGATLHLPGVVDPSTMTTGSEVAESGPFTESEDTFNEVTLAAWKYGHVVKVSDELLNDAGFDVSGFVQRRAGQAIALAVNPRLVNGTGTGQPKGITANTVGVTLATGQTITIASADSLIDVQHSLAVPYRANAVWILHDTTLKLIRKLKDSTNQYIWQPGLVAGQPDRLLNSPVFIDPDMPVPAANAKTVFYGDVKENYVVRRVTGVNLKVLNELYAGNGQVGFRVDRRLDGNIQNPAAARLLQQSAT